jgi:hypothetical protein
VRRPSARGSPRGAAARRRPRDPAGPRASRCPASDRSPAPGHLTGGQHWRRGARTRGFRHSGCGGRRPGPRRTCRGAAAAPRRRRSRLRGCAAARRGSRLRRRRRRATTSGRRDALQPVVRASLRGPEPGMHSETAPWRGGGAPAGRRRDASPVNADCAAACPRPANRCFLAFEAHVDG